MTSVGAMLPRLTWVPKRRISVTCRSLFGASNSSRFSSMPDSAIRSIRSSSKVAVRPADAALAALAGLGDHLGGAGGDVLVEVVDPVLGFHRLRPGRLLVADLAEHGVVGRGAPDVFGLLAVGQIDRAVRDLDVATVEPVDESAPVVESALRDELLEQCATEVIVDAGVLHRVDLVLQVVGDQRRSPAELDHVDQAAEAGNDVREVVGRQPGVDHHRDARGAWFRLPFGEGQSRRVHGWFPFRTRLWVQPGVALPGLGRTQDAPAGEREAGRRAPEQLGRGERAGDDERRRRRRSARGRAGRAASAPGPAAAATGSAGAPGRRRTIGPTRPRSALSSRAAGNPPIGVAAADQEQSGDRGHRPHQRRRLQDRRGPIGRGTGVRRPRGTRPRRRAPRRRRDTISRGLVRSDEGAQLIEVECGDRAEQHVELVADDQRVLVPGELVSSQPCVGGKYI